MVVLSRQTNFSGAFDSQESHFSSTTSLLCGLTLP